MVLKNASARERTATILAESCSSRSLLFVVDVRDEDWPPEREDEIYNARNTVVGIQWQLTNLFSISVDPVRRDRVLDLLQIELTADHQPVQFVFEPIFGNGPQIVAVLRKTKRFWPKVPNRVR